MLNLHRADCLLVVDNKKKKQKNRKNVSRFRHDVRNGAGQLSPASRSTRELTFPAFLQQASEHQPVGGVPVDHKACSWGREPTARKHTPTRRQQQREKQRIDAQRSSRLVGRNTSYRAPPCGPLLPQPSEHGRARMAQVRDSARGPCRTHTSGEGRSHLHRVAEPSTAGLRGGRSRQRLLDPSHRGPLCPRARWLCHVQSLVH